MGAGGHVDDLRAYAKAVGHHWVQAVVGPLVTIVGLIVSSVLQWTIPPTIWLVVLGAMVTWAQFLAWRDLRASQALPKAAGTVDPPAPAPPPPPDPAEAEMRRLWDESEALKQALSDVHGGPFRRTVGRKQYPAGWVGGSGELTDELRTAALRWRREALTSIESVAWRAHFTNEIAESPHDATLIAELLDQIDRYDRIAAKVLKAGRRWPPSIR